MKQEARKLLTEWFPPAMLRILRGVSGGVTWRGDYASWAEASERSTGYDSPVILEKVKAASLKVKNGEAVYERDSVLYNEIQYSWPLLAGLTWIAAQDGGKLNVLDFGGSLGSTYFQNRRFLDTLADVQWSIVEQKAFVEVGKEQFEDDVLKFYHDMDACLQHRSPNTILFSSVIQYLKDPYDVLDRVKCLRFEYILFDRTPFVPGERDRLTLQKVPKKIYPAGYPCRFFAKDRFRALFQDEYNVIAEFESLDRSNIPSSFCFESLRTGILQGLN